TTDAQELVFKTNNVEGFRMTVDATAPRLSFTGAAPTFRLELPNSATNAIGRARANSWAVYSSEVWKENIRTIDNPLAKALALRGVYYNYKPQYGGVKDIGFIAEEVDKVIPEVVYKDDKGAVAAMDYQRLTALLVEALKEEHAKTEAMAKDIAELKAMVATLAAAVKPATSTDTPVIGAGSTTVIDIKPATIGQNVPNPFEGVTSIPYFIPKGVNVAELVISDNGSNELRRVVLGDRGVQSKITLSMSEFTSGVYQYALIVDGKIVDTKSMTLVR
ncbi:MAG: tail fiber domain-containing protein, partial [Candidatus Kapaibacterium sp.]